MSSPVKLWKTSIGCKVIMAVTGVVLVLFVIGHMIGNLQFFLGPEPLNRYAALLQGLGELLWVVRGSLLLALVLHIATSAILTLENQSARPVGYERAATVQASLASRTMIYTGILVAGFVILHILHFTAGTLQPEYFHLMDADGKHDVYAIVIHGFQNIGYSGFYIALMVMLGVHLSHAIQSAFETLGFNHPRHTPVIQKASIAIGAIVAIGFIIVPLSVLTGIVDLPSGGN